MLREFKSKMFQSGMPLSSGLQVQVQTDEQAIIELDICILLKIGGTAGAMLIVDNVKRALQML